MISSSPWSGQDGPLVQLFFEVRDLYNQLSWERENGNKCLQCRPCAAFGVGHMSDISNDQSVVISLFGFNADRFTTGSSCNVFVVDTKINSIVTNGS